MFVSIAAPKKISMLKYSSEYLINVYNYNHTGIVIDGMFITKGCGCYVYFHFFDELYNNYKEAGMSPISLQILPTFFVTFDDSWFSHEMYHSYFPRHRNDIYAYAAEMSPNADYIIFLKEDVAVYKNFFVLLKQLLDQYYDNKYTILKLATDNNRRLSTDLKKTYAYGWWGITITMQRFHQYILFVTYADYRYLEIFDFVILD
ncbi:Uncharacterized protein QTN25_001824 [Entamoeba marina]